MGDFGYSNSMDGRDGEGSTEEYETLIQTTDVELLKRVWRQEKAAPEILKIETDLIARLTGKIELVEENVEQDALSGIDPLTVSLYQMDLDRTQFLLPSYLRIRLQKIEKYIFHILATAQLYNHLSKQEKAFSKTCLVDLEKHLEESVLSKLPNNYQSIFKQSMISKDNDMVAKPQLDTFVVCKTNYYLGHIQLEDNEDGPSDDRNRLFGCQNPLYVVLSGKIYIRVFVHMGASTIWLPFEKLGYHLLTFGCHATIILWWHYFVGPI